MTADRVLGFYWIASSSQVIIMGEKEGVYDKWSFFEFLIQEKQILFSFFFPLRLILAIWSFAFKAAKIYISWSPRRVETYGWAL